MRSGRRSGWPPCDSARMSDHMETEAEVQEELEELGIDNEATGSPDLFMNGVVVRVVAILLVVLLVIGLVFLLF